MQRLSSYYVQAYSSRSIYKELLSDFLRSKRKDLEFQSCTRDAHDGCLDSRSVEESGGRVWHELK